MAGLGKARQGPAGLGAARRGEAGLGKARELGISRNCPSFLTNRIRGATTVKANVIYRGGGPNYSNLGRLDVATTKIGTVYKKWASLTIKSPEPDESKLSPGYAHFEFGSPQEIEELIGHLTILKARMEVVK